VGHGLTHGAANGIHLTLVLRVHPVRRDAAALDGAAVAAHIDGVVTALDIRAHGDAASAGGNRGASRVPGAELLAIEGGEHVAIFTHRDEVRARSGRFLGAHAPAAQ
jgi:hypothetical protein